MGNIVLTTVGTTGSVLPFVRLGKELKNRGHQVALISNSRYRAMAQEERLEFDAIDTDEEFSHFIRDGQLSSSSEGFVTLYRRYFLPKISAEFELLQKRIISHDSLIIARATPGIAARLAAEKCGVPFVPVFLAPNFLDSLSLVEELIGAVLGVEVNQVRSALGFPGVNDWSRWLKTPNHSIGLWPEWFGEPKPTWPMGVTLSGFLLGERSSQAQVPSDIRNFIESSGRPLLITGGTGYFSTDQFFTICAEACRSLSHRGIVVTQFEDQVARVVDDDFKWVAEVPFEAVMPLTAGVIHHGGIGTCAQAIAAGVPQLIMAAGGDRPDNGMRLEHLGVGVSLSATQWTVAQVSARLREITRNARILENCRTISENLHRQAPGAKACDLIDAILRKDRQQELIWSPRSEPSLKDNEQIVGTQSDAAGQKRIKELLNKLSPEKRGLLEIRLRKAQAGGRATERIRRQTTRDKTPLSFSQQRLWFLQRMDPQSYAYNLGGAIRFKGALNIQALEKSFSTIIQRHEILRTVYRMEAGLPHQVVLLGMPVNIAVENMTDVSENTRESTLRDRVASDLQFPFDLERGPVFRIRRYQLSSDEHVVSIVMHHICCDGWSIGVFIRELNSCYEGYVANQHPSLPDLSVQYGDFSAWQREWLQGDVFAEHMAYWKQQLQKMGALELLTDRARPAVQAYRGDRVKVALNADLSDKLRELSRAQNATLFMTLLTGFFAVLHRYTGQKDFGIGTPIANRTHVEIENLIGCFINTLVVRAQIPPRATFLELLEQVRNTTVAAYAHQDLPFERLLDEWNTERDLSHTPLFQVMFGIQNTPATTLELSGVTVSRVNMDSKSSKCDLSLALLDGDFNITGSLEYNTDLFDESTAQRIVIHWERLLEAMVLNPHVEVASGPLVTNAEEAFLLSNGNSINSEVPKHENTFVHELFEEQVSKSPAKSALIDASLDISYGELNHRANRFAKRLQRLGVGPEIHVGLCLERSIDAAIGMLAIWKAGGVYVFLDPSYPKDRLDLMMKEAEVAILITKRTITEDSICRLRTTVFLDDECEQSDEAVAVSGGLLSSHAAYLMFTSGSTGRPKGTLIPHGAFATHCLSIIQEYGLSSDDRVLQFASLSFDVSLEQIWPALLSGATVILNREEIQAPESAIEYILSSRLTVVNFPTAYWHLLVQEFARKGKIVSFGALRLLIVGGEAMLPQAVQSWWEVSPINVRLLNAYGPTETVITATLFEVSSSSGLHSRQRMPIGRIIGERIAYVLDDQMHPVPEGVPGELYLGGVLARGYLGQPEMTAQRFVPDPWGTRSGARVYRTGDLCRWLSNGILEFVGRRDQQVKIRGYRIELTEIENVLLTHPQVKQAAVIMREHQLGDKRLVAYVVLVSPSIEPEELRSYLLAKLPAYMVPGVFVILDQLPMAPNGKLDRKALTAFESSPAEASAVPEAPLSHEETVLLEIWRQVLGNKAISIQDNFFALGGDSILSIQIVARAHEAGVQLTPKQLFQHPTIKELATLPKCCLVSAEQGIVSGPVPLTPIQRWFFEQNVGDQNHFNQAILLEVKEKALLPQTLREVIEGLMHHHDALRMRYEAQLGEWRQWNAPTSEQDVFVQIDLSGLSENEQRLALTEHAERHQRNLNLQCGPIIRVCWFHLGNDRNARLLLIVHHLVMDGISWRILLKHLQQGCQQCLRGEPVALGKKSSSFKQWARQLEEYASSPEALAERDYWSRTAGGVSLLSELNVGDNIVHSSRTVKEYFSQEATQKLITAVPQKCRARLEEAILSTAINVIEHWIGGEGVLVNLEGHGREELFDHLDLSATIGWFTTIYPVKLTAGIGRQAIEQLGRIKEQLRSVPKRGIGYGVLRYLRCDTPPELITQRGGEISFNYLGQLDHVIEEHGIFSKAFESIGSAVSAMAQRPHLIDITAWVSEGRLGVSWTYSVHRHRAETISRLAKEHLEGLSRLLAESDLDHSIALVPSDFPLSKLNQADLAELVAEIRKAGS